MQGGGQESGEPEIPKAWTDPALSMVLTSLWYWGAGVGDLPLCGALRQVLVSLHTLSLACLRGS